MNIKSIDAIYDRNGGTYVADTSTYAGPYHGIMAHTDTVIASLTCALWGNTPTAIPVSAGSYLPFPGGAKNVTLTSGHATLVIKSAND
jgi:hypothetical protein